MKSHVLIKKMRNAIREIEQGAVGRHGVSVAIAERPRMMPEGQMRVLLRRHLHQNTLS